jgi:hypothetical protein
MPFFAQTTVSYEKIDHNISFKNANFFHKIGKNRRKLWL